MSLNSVPELIEDIKSGRPVILVDDEGGFVGIRTAHSTAFSNVFKGHASLVKVLAAELIGKRLPSGVSADDLLASFEKFLPDLGLHQLVDRQPQHELSV